MASKECGTIEFFVLSAQSKGLDDGDDYLVQINVPDDLASSGNSFRTATVKASELKWNCQKAVKMTKKIERDSSIKVSLLRHRTLLSDVPIAIGQCSIWDLFKGKPVQQNITVNYLPKVKGSDDAGGQPAATVSLRFQWKDGNVPDLNLGGKMKPGDKAAAPDAAPGEYEGHTDPAGDVSSLPACEGQDYRVHVRIHKARGLQAVKASKVYDPYVQVKIGEDEQKTDYIKKTNEPIFDEELVFTFDKVDNQFWSTPITLGCWDHYTVGTNELIGDTTIDCGTVYRENAEHYASNKWYVIHEDLATTGRVKGFMKVSIAVLNARTDAIPEYVDEEEDEDQIITNLVSGPGARFEKVHLDLDVLRAEDLPKMDIDLGIRALGSLAGGSADPFVKFAFAKEVVKTHHIDNNLNPVWDTQLDLPMMLPALTQNVIMSVWDHDATSDDRIATHRFDIEKLLRDTKGEKRALPCFATQWVTLYGNPRGSDTGGLFNSYFKRMAKGEVPGCDYRGRILVGIEGSRNPVPARPPSKPQTTKVTFGVKFQVTHVSLVPSGKYEIVVTCGLESDKSGHKKTTDMIGESHFEYLSVDHEMSLQVTMDVVVPDDPDCGFTIPSQLPDVIVSLYPISILGHREDAPFAYARLPMESVWNKPCKEQHCVSLMLLSDPAKQSSGTEPAMPLAQVACSVFSMKADPAQPQLVPEHETTEMPPLPGEESKRRLLEANVFHAKQLPAGDDNGLSDPYVRVQWANGTAETGYKLETLSPCFNQMLPVIADTREQVRFPDIIVELWDHDMIGRDTFLGRRLISVSDAQDEGRAGEPRWYGDFTDSQGHAVPGCKVLMSFLLKGGTKSLEKKTMRKFRRKLGGNRETYKGFPVDPKRMLKMSQYKIDVDIIGLRHMKKFRLFNLRHPSVAVEVGESRVSLDPLYGANPTFNKTFSVVANLPTEPDFLPEVSFRVYDHRLGTKQLVGCAYMLLNDERCDPDTVRSRNAKLDDDISMRLKKIIDVKSGIEVEHQDPTVTDPVPRQRPTLQRTAQAIRGVAGKNLFADAAVEPVPAPPSAQPAPGALGHDGAQPLLAPDQSSVHSSVPHARADHSPLAATPSHAWNEDEEEELASLDKNDEQDLWFDRFMPQANDTSVEAAHLVSRLGKLGSTCGLPSSKSTVEDYFGPFDDYSRIEIRRGWGDDARKAGDLLTQTLCKRLGPVDGDGAAEDGASSAAAAADAADLGEDTVKVRNIDRRRPTNVVVRVYIITASKLTAKDSGPFGKASDPYIKLQLTSDSKDSKTVEKTPKDSLRKQTLNPEFYVTDELDGELPKHNTLRVQIYDQDMIGSDDLIGFTDIDLEDRWYSRRGYVGGAGSSTLAPGSYTEKRTLRDKSGRSAGTLEMWVDMFEPKKQEVPRAIDIAPPPPIEMELRATVWNARDVQLVDKNFADDMMTDIYIRGWLGGLDDDRQQTDVHYRSLDGTGNFNWRLIFDVMFDPRTQQIWAKKRDGLLEAFSIEKEPKKLTPVLQLQIWDNDLFPGTDDFIAGTNLTMTNLFPVQGHRYDQEIGKMESCCPCHFFPFNRCCKHRVDPAELSLEEKQQLAHDEMAYENSVREAKWEAMAEEKMEPYYKERSRDPTKYSDRFLERLKRKFLRDAKRETQINIFQSFMPKKQKKKDIKDKDCARLDIEPPDVSETSKYWFACRAPDGGYRAGDVQISFQLVRKDAIEANEKLAAGRGRSDPNKMPEPDRPKTSFFWLTSPVRTAYYILWKHYKWYIITVIVLVILALYIFIFMRAAVETKANHVFGAEEQKVVIEQK